MASTPDKVPVHDALSPGTRLDEFEIVRVLGTGGFGIVYLARDHVLLRDVAIKEYMPASLAGRGQGVTVSLRAPGFADIFAKGLESFLSEARLLASFDHRSLVKVHRFWRSNATAYMAMQYYRGRTLKDAREHMRTAPDAAWLAAFMQSILGVLELLHGEGVFHRDISPDNILMLDDGRPVLLDFGSARRVVAHGPQSFTAHLKPQFAPLEQYADEAGGMRQGPWTDLYALGATVHFVLTGRAPTPSVVRAVRDALPTLSSLAASTFPGVPARLLATIDWTLALAPEQRPQSVHSVRRALSGEIAPPPSRRQRVEPPTSAVMPAPVAIEVGDPAPAKSWYARLPARVSALVTPLTTARGADGGGARRVSLAAALAFVGAGALGLGAWTLNRPASISPTTSTASVEAPRARPRVQTTADGSLAPITSAAADPHPLRVAPIVVQGAAIASDPIPVSATETRPAAAATSVAAPAARIAARERRARPHVKVQGVVAPVKVAQQPVGHACRETGFLARTLCVLQRCDSPRTRTSSQCAGRWRAEEARLQRIERQ